jgi:ribosomal protein L37AE/L43A
VKYVLWLCPDCSDRTVSPAGALRVTCRQCGQEWIRESQLPEGDPRLDVPKPQPALTPSEEREFADY